MFSLIKVIGVAIAGGAVVGALGSSKLGSFLRKDDEKVRAKRTSVQVVEVPVDSDDPANLEFVVIKRTKDKKNKKSEE